MIRRPPRSTLDRRQRQMCIRDSYLTFYYTTILIIISNKPTVETISLFDMALVSWFRQTIPRFLQVRCHLRYLHSRLNNSSHYSKSPLPRLLGLSVFRYLPQSTPHLLLRHHYLQILLHHRQTLLRPQGEALRCCHYSSFQHVHLPSPEHVSRLFHHVRTRPWNNLGLTIPHPLPHGN